MAALSAMVPCSYGVWRRAHLAGVGTATSSIPERSIEYHIFPDIAV